MTTVASEVSGGGPLPLPMAPADDGDFLDEVLTAAAGNTRLEYCLQCGTCGGSCPSAAEMDYTPRHLFALIRAGRRAEVLSSKTPWMCVSCYHCVVRCPQQIQITDVMYALKNVAVRSRRYRAATAVDFSKTFVGLVEIFGRSFETGLAGIHYMAHFPWRLPGMMPAIVGLLSRSRLAVAPAHIRNLGQLKAILARAKELEVSR